MRVDPGVLVLRHATPAVIGRLNACCDVVLSSGAGPELAAALLTGLAAARAARVLAAPAASSAATSNALQELAESVSEEGGRRAVVQAVVCVPGALSGLLQTVQVCCL